MLSVDLWFTTFCREKRIGASLVRLPNETTKPLFVDFIILVHVMFRVVTGKENALINFTMNTYDSTFEGAHSHFLGEVLISRVSRLAERSTAGQTTSVPILMTGNEDWNV
jgi:hypothetical protein